MKKSPSVATQRTEMDIKSIFFSLRSELFRSMKELTSLSGVVREVRQSNLTLPLLILYRPAPRVGLGQVGAIRPGLPSQQLTATVSGLSGVYLPAHPAPVTAWNHAWGRMWHLVLMADRVLHTDSMVHPVIFCEITGLLSFLLIVGSHQRLSPGHPGQ